jgi:hypothetical protein
MRITYERLAGFPPAGEAAGESSPVGYSRTPRKEQTGRANVPRLHLPTTRPWAILRRESSRACGPFTSIFTGLQSDQIL